MEDLFLILAILATAAVIPLGAARMGICLSTKMQVAMNGRQGAIIILAGVLRAAWYSLADT
jgi:hypothetical protein